MNAAIAPEQFVLPVFTVPDVRRDLSAALAIYYREICLHDAGEGAFFKTEHVAKKYLKCHPGTVRRYGAMLVKLGLAERRVEHGRELYVRPLVPLQALFDIWPELAFVCSTCTRLSGLMRSAAKQAIKKVKGVMAQYRPRQAGELRPVHPAPKEGSPAGRSGGLSEGSSNAEVCALREPSIPPLSCIQRRRGKEKTTTSSDPKATERPSAPSKSEAQAPEVADASLAELSAPLVEALGEAPAKPLTALAQKLGRTASHVRQCVRAAKAKPDVLNLGAYLRRLIEAPEGSVAPPIDTPSHASDRGERPQRTTTTPPEDRAKMEAAKKAEHDRDAAFEAAWKAIGDTAMKARLEAAREQLRAKGGFYRSQIDSKGIGALCVQSTARSEFRAEWEAARSSSFEAQCTAWPENTCQSGEAS